MLICVCSIARTGCPSGDLTLLSLSIKLFESELSLLPHTHTHILTSHTHTHTHTLTCSHHTHTHTHTHTQLVTELRGVNVDIQFPQLRAYLPSWCICSPHVADRQQRQEKREFGAATVKLVQPSAYNRVGPLLTNCSVLNLGIFHFSDT